MKPQRHLPQPLRKETYVSGYTGFEGANELRGTLFGDDPYPKRLRLGPGHVATRCPECEGEGLRGSGTNKKSCKVCGGVGYLGVKADKPVDLKTKDARLHRVARIAVYARRVRAKQDIWTGQPLSVPPVQRRAGRSRNTLKRGGEGLLFTCVSDDGTP